MCGMGTHDWPGILAMVAEVAGDAAAAALARERGGIRCYIPAQVRDGHWLTELVGLEAAEAICRAIGGGEVEVPLAGAGLTGRTRRRMAEMIRNGLPAPRIARTLGISERTVRRHKARLRQRDARQPGLFDDLDECG